MRQPITDSFIISLSSTNTLGVRLSGLIPEAKICTSLVECGRRLRRSTKVDSVGSWLLMSYAMYAAKMARACEKLDHIEDYPFRDAITEAIGAICSTSITAADVFDFDLTRSVEDRLRNTWRLVIFFTDCRRSVLLQWRFGAARQLKGEISIAHV
jgi:hypothetical protein